MRDLSEHEAIVQRDRSISYAGLAAMIGEWDLVFERHGIDAGSVVGLRGDYSPETCSLFLALVLHRCVVVTLPMDDDVAAHLAASQPAAVFDFADSARWVCVARRPAVAPPVLHRLRARGLPGLVVFSSGTTGQCKAVLFDLDRLLERYRQPRPAHRALAFLLFDHLGGIHTMLHTLTHGGVLVMAAERRPDAVARAIEQHRVELLPATPTFLRLMVMARVHERYDLSSLRLITYGTEPMASSTLEHLRRIFPAAVLKQTYGLTELGVLPTRSQRSGSLWLRLGGQGCEAEVRDNVLWVRSETAMLGYLNAPDPFDADGWYNTHDAVETNGDYIRILGRTSELINVGGQKVYPSEVESVLLEIDGVCEATVWGEPNPITGQVVVARVSLAWPEASPVFERRMHRFCHERLAAYKIPVTVDIVEGAHHGQRFKKVRPAGRLAPT